MEFINSTERIEIEIEIGRLYVCIRTRAISFCLFIGGFLPVIEFKSVRWFFSYKLRLSFGNFAFEWVDYTKSSGRFQKPDSRFWYWGMGEWAAMTDEEYAAWKAEESDNTHFVEGNDMEYFMSEKLRSNQPVYRGDHLIGMTSGESKPCWRDDCDGTAIFVALGAHGRESSCAPPPVWLCSRGLCFRPWHIVEGWTVLKAYSDLSGILACDGE